MHKVALTNPDQQMVPNVLTPCFTVDDNFGTRCMLWDAESGRD